MSTDVVVLGGGDHAHVVVEVLHELGRAVVGWVGPDGDGVPGLRRLGTDDVLASLDPRTVELVNGVGSTGDAALRARVHASAAAQGFGFATVIAPSAVVAPSAVLGSGTVVLANAVVATGAVLDHDVIVNTSAVVEHDCRIGAHTHISPGAVLAGRVEVGDGSHVGLGARVIQGVRIGSHCTIGAGAVVLADIPDDALAIGVPASVRSRS